MEALRSLERLYEELLEHAGEDLERDGIEETPLRAAKAWMELTRGLREDPREVLKMFEGTTDDSMVIVRDIPTASMCEHHLLPYTGFTHIGYIPDGRILGLSKFGRLVRIVGAKPSVQEHFTCGLADLLMEELHCKGVMVVQECEHTCMTIRGVQMPGTTTTTSAVRGVFLDHERQARLEFLSLIARRP